MTAVAMNDYLFMAPGVVEWIWQVFKYGLRLFMAHNW